MSIFKIKTISLRIFLKKIIRIKKIKLSDFKIPNMADIWLGKFCKEQNVKCICIQHENRWINYQKVQSHIYTKFKNLDPIQTKLVNSF